VAARVPIALGGLVLGVALAACSLLVDTGGFEGSSPTLDGSSPFDGGPEARADGAVTSSSGTVGQEGGAAAGGTGQDAGGTGPDTGGSAYAAAVLADQPVVYLRLGDTPGQLQASDRSGHGNDAAYLGNVGRSIPGALAGDPDTAVRFDGSDSQLVRLTAAFDFDGAKPFSLELWIRPEGTIDGDFNDLVGRSGFTGWALFMQSNTLKFQRSTSAGTTWEGPWFTTPLPSSRFSHVVGTFDGSSMHLFVDGLDVSSSNAQLVLAASTDPIQMGAHFPGSLDEVALYDHALSADRIKAHHQIGAGP
jgi:hypothetical protein